MGLPKMSDAGSISLVDKWRIPFSHHQFPLMKALTKNLFEFKKDLGSKFSKTLLYAILNISSVLLATLTPVISIELDHNLDSTERQEIINEIENFNTQALTLIRKTYDLYSDDVSENTTPKFDEELKFHNTRNGNTNITNEELESIARLMIPSLDRYIKEFEIVRNIEQESRCIPIYGKTADCFAKLCRRSGSINVAYCCLESTIRKLKKIKAFLHKLFIKLRKDVRLNLRNNITQFSLQEQEEFTMTILRRTSMQLDYIQETLKKL
uniref:Uncharacterized protein n=1 Tax=Octopus bimaculoides TaxID=37653 RepID=A0A0L8HRT9_OCTBM